jgi:hypothetical protein
VSDHGFAGDYQAVKRFVRKLRGPQRPEAAGIILTAPGEEAQVDYGSGPMVRDPKTGILFAERLFERPISSQEIFHSNGGYSWGNQDKLCQVNSHQVHIVRYQPWADSEPVENLGTVDFEMLAEAETIDLAPWKGGVVSGGTALFGTVIECKNAIVVVPSEGPVQTLPGEPTNWRIFTRSVQYENHLHVIYADRLEIFSFNQDYLVNQEAKLSGINANYLGLSPGAASRFRPRRSRKVPHQLDWPNREE